MWPQGLPAPVMEVCVGVTIGAPRKCVLGPQGLTHSRPDVSQQETD